MNSGSSNDGKFNMEGQSAANRTLSLSFRETLQMTAPACDAAQDMPATSFDSQLAKILIDFKFGRTQQSQKRFASICEAHGFAMHTPLILQPATFTEETAVLLIFELLFMLKDNSNPAEELIWKYFETVSWFDPDDTICHGALYNLLMIFFMRQTNLAAAAELAKLSLTAFRQCNSLYLEGFIHLHLAYIHLYEGRLSIAELDLEAASERFENTYGAEDEKAETDITRLWIQSERTGILPELNLVLELKDRLANAGFWPETFLTLAAMVFRTALESDAERALEYHSVLEAILRVRGMTNMLPAMQLLRDEHFTGDRAGKIENIEPMNLSERQLLLLMPNNNTLRLNWPRMGPKSALQLPRMKALQALTKGEMANRESRFDIAAPHFFEALELIERHEFLFLLKSSYSSVSAFLRECRKRKRFVEQARHYQNNILTTLKIGTNPLHRPADLTASEFGVLRRLAVSTSNKALARELDVSETTIKFHLRNIYRKLGVNTRRNAITAAAAKGWIDLGIQSGEYEKPSLK